MKAIDRRYIRMALRRAIEWDDSLIDSFKVTYSKKRNASGLHPKIIPREYQAQARMLRRNIAHYNRLLASIA